jgi:phytoene dehydrogenase-like protein
MSRYEAAIIGAGPEGLVASIILARAGLRVLVLEKSDEPGGRATTLEFHPGFRASPYADELPPMSHRLYRSLGLAQRGALLVPSPATVAITDAGTSVLFANDERLARSTPPEAASDVLAFKREMDSARKAVERRAAMVAPAPRRSWFASKPTNDTAPWPAGAWLSESLADFLRDRVGDQRVRMHLVADTTSGRAVSPFLAGSALHALAPGVGGSGQPPAGLGRLGRALADVAVASGVTIRCNATVTAVSLSNARAKGVVIGTGESIEAAAVLSALDLRATVLGLVDWSELPDNVSKRVGRFRTAGQRARVLFALAAAPDVPFARDMPDAAQGPIHIVPSLEEFSRSYDSWRAGIIPERPLITLRVPSFADPRLAPIGKAVLTATLSAIPARLFDGVWTNAKRNQLAEMALAAAERAMPGITARVLARHVMVGPDFESALGATAGDLDGGELSPDQVLNYRPFGGADWQDGRTPFHRLYLGGPSSAASPFWLGASGERAALAMLADFEARRLR